jgi:hypothetical protein
VDQRSGVRGRADVLLALAQYRRFNGRCHFGVLLVAERAAIGGAATWKSGCDDYLDSSNRAVQLCVGDHVLASS